MHHYFEAITNTSGDSLVGYFARVIDPATQNTVTMSADDNGTPIVTKSGVENMGSTDDYGNLDFYVVPGTYHLDIYAPNATSFIFRVPNVAMNSSKGDTGPVGEQGPAGEGLAEVMAPTGAGLVGFIDTAAGAVSRKVGDELLGLSVPPERFGAIGNGTADDTAALQAAFNTGRSVRLTQGRTYKVGSKLTIASSNVSLSGGGTIKVAPTWNFAADTDGNGTHMRTIFVTGNFVTIEGVFFDATGSATGTAVENGFLWCTGFSPTVSNCQFVGNPKGTAIWGLAGAAYMTVTGNKFFSCSGAVFAKGRSTVISNNNILDASDAAIALNGVSCSSSSVIGNLISNEAGVPIPSMIAAEEGAYNWTIVGNVCLGANGGGIVATNVLDSTPVKGGIIANNIIDGMIPVTNVIPTRTDPAALLSIGNVYSDWIIHDNDIRNCPLGNSNSRLVILSATGGSFHDNLIDATGTPGLSSTIDINSGAGGIIIKDNDVRIASGRHYLFNAGNYGNAPCVFIGGKMTGGTEGINAENSAAGITNFKLHIRDLQEASMASVVNAATAIGSRGAFLNAGAWAYPHRIGIFTEMRGNGVPASPGNQPFFSGDKIYELSPVAPGREGVIRVGATWRDFGSIV